MNMLMRCNTYIISVHLLGEIHFNDVSSESHVDIGGLIDSVDVSGEAILTNVPVNMIVK